MDAERMRRIERHLVALMSNQGGELDRRLKLAAFYILAAEELRQAIVDKVRFFLGADGTMPPSRHLDGKFKGLKSPKPAERLKAAVLCFREMDAIDEVDQGIIEYAIELRNDAAHEMAKMLWDFEADRFSEAYVFSMMATTFKINRWWFINVEADLIDDEEQRFTEEMLQNVETVGAQFTKQLFLAAFPQFAAQVAELSKSKH